MRWAIAFGMIAACAVAAQDKVETPPPRYGVNADLRRYPQATPKETFASVLQAIDQKRYDYLLAHLVDPAFVDERVKKLGGFDELVGEMRTKLNDNPDAVKELRRFLKQGEWETNEDKASAFLKDVKDRRVYFRKIETRWFMENKQEFKAPAEKEKKEP